MPAKISHVEENSPASKKRIKPGWSLVSINGNPIIDVLDYMYFSYEPVLELELLDLKGRTKHKKLRKQEGQDAGLDFEDYLMDKPRACANRCIFCFIDQLPKGLRETLYFKDDDARLSFLTGNYVTLTNLSAREIQRIIDLKISPINVSVHTTDPDLRQIMLHNRRAGELMGIMRRFSDAGIVMNCQIVVCPDVNDGEKLFRTLKDLSGLFPGVHSVSVVPVGLTKHREGLPVLKPVGKTEAAAILDIVDSFGDASLKLTGSRFAFCADEFYLRAERPLPSYEYYEDFPQFENGVGMLRSFASEFLDALAVARCPRYTNFSIACGTAVAPFLTNLLQIAKGRYDKLNHTVYPIRNEFFGETVDVSGLLTGQDLYKQLSVQSLGEAVLLSATMLRHGGDVFLDDMQLDALSLQLGVPVIPVAQDGGALIRAIFEMEIEEEEKRDV